MCTRIVPRLTLLSVVALLVIGWGSSQALAQHHGGGHGGGHHGGHGVAHHGAIHHGGHGVVHHGRRHVGGHLRGHVGVHGAAHHSGGHIGGHRVTHHGGHHLDRISHHGGHQLHHFGHHSSLFFSVYWPSARWYSSYGRSVRPAYYTTISQQPTSQLSPQPRRGEGDPMRLQDEREAEPGSIPDGVPMSAPLVETLEAPEALPPLDEEDESQTSHDEPLIQPPGEAPDR